MMNNLRKTSPDNIERALCFMFHVKPDELRSHSRPKHLTIPRFILWKTLSEYSELSSVSIAARYNRDHTTILHGLSRAKHHDVADRYSIFLALVRSGKLVDNYVDNVGVTGDKTGISPNNPHLDTEKSPIFPQITPEDERLVGAILSTAATV